MADLATKALTMQQIQITQAKARLSSLLERVEAGEEIVITRRGRPIARLVPERTDPRTAAEAPRKVWALGGLQLDEIIKDEAARRPADPESSPWPDLPTSERPAG